MDGRVRPGELHKLVVPGPSQPPKGARILRLRAWGNARGVVWQFGQMVGTIWDQLPEWGTTTPRWKSTMIPMTGGSPHARRHFNTLLASVKRMGLGRLVRG